MAVRTMVARRGCAAGRAAGRAPTGRRTAKPECGYVSLAFDRYIVTFAAIGQQTRPQPPHAHRSAKQSHSVRDHRDSHEGRSHTRRKIKERERQERGAAPGPATLQPTSASAAGRWSRVRCDPVPNAYPRPGVMMSCARRDVTRNWDLPSAAAPLEHGGRWRRGRRTVGGSRSVARPEGPASQPRTRHPKARTNHERCTKLSQKAGRWRRDIKIRTPCAAPAEPDGTREAGSVERRPERTKLPKTGEWRGGRRSGQKNRTRSVEQYAVKWAKNANGRTFRATSPLAGTVGRNVTRPARHRLR